MLVLKTVIYASKLLDFQNFASLELEHYIILAALGIAQASLALPSFSQNLHKIWNLSVFALYAGQVFGFCFLDFELSGLSGLGCSR